MNKNLFLQENPQTKDLPTTPKKKSKFREIDHDSPSRIKYRYTIVEKPTSSCLANLFVLFWIAVFVGALYLSYQSKVTQLETNIREEISQCQKDFTTNKCEAPLKGLKVYCEEKRICMSEDPAEMLKRRVSGTLMLGETIREFFDGLGLPLILVGMVYAIFGGRRNKEVKKEFVEYC